MTKTEVAAESLNYRNILQDKLPKLQIKELFFAFEQTVYPEDESKNYYRKIFLYSAVINNITIEFRITDNSSYSFLGIDVDYRKDRGNRISISKYKDPEYSHYKIYSFDEELDIIVKQIKSNKTIGYDKETVTIAA